MILFNKSFNYLIRLMITFLVLFENCRAAGPPKWGPHTGVGFNPLDQSPHIYATEENPNAKYDPNLPESQRKEYIGKTSNPDIVSIVCGRNPDSGYYCPGAVGDLPPLHQRFYWDIYTNTCKCMLYNGCDGNANNFRSYEHCMEWCSPKTSLFDRRSTKTVYSFAKNNGKCLYFY